MVAWTQIEGECVDVDIDSQFESLMPPLTAEERAELEASIAADGVRDPLVAWEISTDDDWRYVLLDGHNRYRIAEGMPGNVVMEVHALSFPHRAAAMAWMITNQFARRNLSAFVRVKLALRLKEALADARASGASIEGRLNDHIGQMASGSHEQVRKVQMVLDQAPESVRASAENGDLSINRAWLVTKALGGVPVEVNELAERHQLDDPDTIRLIARLYEDGRDSFWDLYRTGYIQPGEEDEAVHITEGYAALTQAVARKASDHRRESVAVKQAEADATPLPELDGVKMVVSSVTTFAREAVDSGELFTCVTLAGSADGMAAIASDFNTTRWVTRLLAFDGVLFVRLGQRDAPKVIPELMRAGLVYSGWIVSHNVTRKELALTYVLARRTLDMSDRDYVEMTHKGFEWRYDDWARILMAFCHPGRALDLMPVSPAYAAVGAAHVFGDLTVVVPDSGQANQAARLISGFDYVTARKKLGRG